MSLVSSNPPTATGRAARAPCMNRRRQRQRLPDSTTVKHGSTSPRDSRARPGPSPSSLPQRQLTPEPPPHRATNAQAAAARPGPRNRPQEPAATLSAPSPPQKSRPRRRRRPRPPRTDGTHQLSPGAKSTSWLHIHLLPRNPPAVPGPRPALRCPHLTPSCPGQPRARMDLLRLSYEEAAGELRRHLR
jgi:hypothetical protein